MALFITYFGLIFESKTQVQSPSLMQINAARYEIDIVSNSIVREKIQVVVEKAKFEK